MDKNIGYVICEGFTVESESKIISENGNRVIAEGIVQTADEVNRNGRIYRKEDLIREINSPRTVELLQAGYMRGESGHPTDQNLARQQTIAPSNVCVKFLKFWIDGANIMAQFKGTNNELGRFFDADLREGDKPAFSLRGLGVLKSTPRGNQVDNLRMICYDHVIFPSHERAYTTKLVSESANLGGNSVNESELHSSAKPLLVPITNQSVINYIKSESANIKSMLNCFDIFYESIKLVNNGHDVQLMDKDGNLFVVNLESYISNEIMDYCFKR